MERSDFRSFFDSSRSRSPSAMDSKVGLEPDYKRIKGQDLDLMLCTEESPKLEAKVHANMCMKGETCRTTDGLQEGKSQCSLSLLECIGHVDSSHSLTNLSISENTNSASVTDVSCETLVPKRLEKDIDLNISTSSGFGMDLNADYASNVVNEDPFYPYKRPDHVKSRQPSECGSSTGPLEESEPLRKWKAMKQNGFLSSSHGGIPIPKQRGTSRKNKSDALNRKMELAKKEQVNRFAKMAAPSGLLTGLNPGIINHVRNGKQVQSIIEALVRSEKLDDQIQNRPVDQNHTRGGNKEGNYGNNCPDNSEIDHPSKILPLSRQPRGDQTRLSRLSITSSMEHKSNGLDLDVAERRIYYQPSTFSHFTSEYEDNTLRLKLSAGVNVASDNTSCTSSEELSANQESTNSLSLKAATVASQWLDLLQQDIKGRLAALRRSKKRIRGVIQRELPSLLSKEFLPNQENAPNLSQSSSSGCSSNENPEMHMSKWRSLFSQMEKALSEEGKHLETWLGQVREMQLHCEQGLQYVKVMGINGLQQPVSSEDSRSKKAKAAVRAAAASIYSTCNLVMTAENVSCF